MKKYGCSRKNMMYCREVTAHFKTKNKHGFRKEEFTKYRRLKN